MAATYPETLARFRGRPNIMARSFDWKKLTGGVLHAKYFIVDGREAYVGSQNFDWRSLAHIQETGLRIRSPLFAVALGRIFEADWQYSGGDETAYRKAGAGAAPCLSRVRHARGQPGTLQSARRPRRPGGFAGPDRRRPLPHHGSAAFLQPGKEDSPEKFTAIDQALRRAAGRGVRVRMLVADWNLRPPQVGDLQNLARLPNIEIKFAVIPGLQPRLYPLRPRRPLQGHARR